MKRKIYVFDLDQTLCQTPVGNEILVGDNTGNEKYMSAKPKKERIAFVNKLHDDGNIIIIETARGCISGKNWLYETIDQLRGWGLKFDLVRTGVKLAADYYIDDKAISDGDFFKVS